MAYVYAIAVDGSVRYIGKGIKQRYKEHVQIAKRIIARREAGERIKANRFYNGLAKALRSGSNIEEFIIVDGLSDSIAFSWEKAEIALHENLWNHQEGGAGTTSASQKRLYEIYPDLQEAKRRRLLAAWKDPEYRRRYSDVMRAAKATEEGKRRASAAAKLVANRPEHIEFQRNAMRKRWQCALYREVMREMATEIGRAPHVKAAKSAASKSHWDDPVWRARQIERQKAAWEKGGDVRRENARAKQSAVMKQRWADPEHRKKLMAGRKKAATPNAEFAVD